jgi:uncharacterized coiled-coil protein SlyX
VAACQAGCLCCPCRRIDDLNAQLKDVRVEIRDVREEMRSMRTEMRGMSQRISDAGSGITRQARQVRDMRAIALEARVRELERRMSELEGDRQASFRIDDHPLRPKIDCGPRLGSWDGSRERLALLYYINRSQLERLGPGIMRIVYGAVGHNEAIAGLDLKGRLALNEDFPLALDHVSDLFAGMRVAPGGSSWSNLDVRDHGFPSRHRNVFSLDDGALNARTLRQKQQGRRGDQN